MTALPNALAAGFMTMATEIDTTFIEFVWSSNVLAALPDAIDEASYSSNTASYFSNIAAATSDQVASNALQLLLNSVAITGLTNTITDSAAALSNTLESQKGKTDWLSNSGVYTSNNLSALQGSFQVYSNITSSNLAFVSNSVISASNALNVLGPTILSNCAQIIADNTAILDTTVASFGTKTTWASNVGTSAFNTSMDSSNILYSTLIDETTYGSNTATWSSNFFGGVSPVYNCNLGVWGSNNFSNVTSTTNTITKNLAGTSNIAVYSSNSTTWASNAAVFGSNSVSNIAGISNIASYSSNSATWSSNSAIFASNTCSNIPGTCNLAVFASNTTTALSNNYFNNTSNMIFNGSNTAIYASNTAGLSSNTFYNSTSNTVYRNSNAAIFGSNTGVFASNVAVFASATAVSSSNTFYFNTSNTVVTSSNTANYASNMAFWASNTGIFASNATSNTTGTSNFAVYASNTATASSNMFYTSSSNIMSWNSNTAVCASNLANYASNAATWSSNVYASTSNTAVFGSNTAIFGSNTAFFASNATSNTTGTSNITVYASNTATSSSNMYYNFTSNTVISTSNTAIFASNATSNTTGTSNIAVYSSNYMSNLYTYTGALIAMSGMYGSNFSNVLGVTYANNVVSTGTISAPNLTGTLSGTSTGLAGVPGITVQDINVKGSAYTNNVSSGGVISATTFVGTLNGYSTGSCGGSSTSCTGNANGLMNNPSITVTNVIANGNVGIGTTQPLYPLHIANQNFTNQSGYGYIQAGGNNTGANFGSLSGFNIGMCVNNYAIAAGFVAVSDQRVKTEIHDISDETIDLIMTSIQPRVFQHIDESLHGHDVTYGFIAQELKDSVQPHAALYVNSHAGDIPSVMKTFEVIVLSCRELILKNAFLFCKGYNRDTVLSFRDEYDSSLFGTFCGADYQGDVKVNLLSDLSVDVVNIFWYGERVSDLLAVDHTQLFTISLAATKNMYLHVKDLTAQVSRLQEDAKSMMSMIEGMRS